MHHNPADEGETADTFKVSVPDMVCSASPKRKREVTDVQGRTQSPNRLRTNLPTRSHRRDYVKLLDPTSPRSKIGDELKKLSINFDIPPPDFRNPNTPTLSVQPPVSSTLDVSLPSHPLLDSDVALEQPSAPPQQAAPTISSRTTSRIQQNARASSNVSSPQEHKAEGTPLTQPLNSSSNSSTPSTNTNLEPERKYQRASRKRSPPPTSSTNKNSDLVWISREITGHDPTDPADDGYGINGIGFRPTPSTAQARAQKRRQQLAEWRSREAKEARQRRFDRRKEHDQSPTREGKVETPTRRKAVRFLED